MWLQRLFKRKKTDVVRFQDLPEHFLAEARKHENARDYQKAIEAYTVLVKMEPGCYRHFYNRGVMHGYLNHVEEALSDYTRAIELNPKHHNSRLNRSVAYMDKGEIEKGITDAEECLRLNPDSVAQVNLQWMYKRRIAS